jgi:hypothetical protein
MYKALTLFLVIFLTVPSWATPTISAVSGTISDGQSVTLTVTGAGSKSAAAPTIWDNCQHGQAISTRWSGAWPNLSGAPYDMAYSTAIRSIAMPHSHTTKYLRGCHFPNSGADQGYNVIVYKNITISLPQDVFATWYDRTDDAWNVGGGDNNFKIFDYSNGTQPFDPTNWYLNFAPPVPSSNPQLQMNDDSSTAIENPDQNAHNVYWSVVPAPWAGSWKKIEVWLRLSNASGTGFFKWWENGSLKVDYKGKTDPWSGTSRTVGLGGYARSQNNATQYRYFADILLDNTPQRVVIGNASSWASCTVREAQPTTAWADTSITATINQASFADGTTAYAYVLDNTNTPNTTGFSVVFGGSSAGGNQPPTVDAGVDQNISLPSTASLDATVSDDVAVVGSTWTKNAGPGSVTFGNANAVDTTASFSLAGFYTLTLAASDGVVETTDTVNISVGALSGSGKTRNRGVFLKGLRLK